MAVVYSTPAKAARMQAVADLIDAGSGVGRLEFGTGSMAEVLASIALAKPCGIVAGSVLTLAGFPKSDTDANASGTPVAARLVDSDGNEIVTGLTVGTTTGDVRLAVGSIVQHQTVMIDSATFTHAG